MAYASNELQPHTTLPTPPFNIPPPFILQYATTALANLLSYYMCNKIKKMQSWSLSSVSPSLCFWLSMLVCCGFSEDAGLFFAFCNNYDRFSLLLTGTHAVAAAESLSWRSFDLFLSVVPVCPYELRPNCIFNIAKQFDVDILVL